MTHDRKRSLAALSGAAFLMATSAIGPGFISNTTKLTQDLAASFGFVILISVLLDIIVQLNLWRIITGSGAPAQDIANKMLPGMGHLLTLLVASGGLLFNIGNIAGCALGLKVLTGWPLTTGALISAGIAIIIFIVKDAGRAMDWFARILGVLMIGLMAYVCFEAKPNMGEALTKTFIPDRTSALTILIIVGGTVGGYISFAGAHRLLQSGLKDPKQVSRGAISGIGIASIMRYLLFLAAFGIVAQGIKLSAENPAETVFRSAAGETGRKLFGLVLWSAAITSVVGSAFTSVSFLKSLHRGIAGHQKWAICIFIIVSAAVFILTGQPPAELLTFAGAANGVILPFALAIMLWAVHKNKTPHPKWLWYSGWMVVAVMGFMSVKQIFKM